MRKKVLSMIMVTAMVAALGGCQTQSEKNVETSAKTEVSKEETTSQSSEETQTDGTKTAEETDGTFIVGFDQDFPPMGFLGDDGEYTGFDLDLAKEVASRLELEFVPQPISWEAKDMELESGNIDCIWNGFTMTGREDEYTWSKPYMNNTQVIVVNKDSDIKSMEDLAGKIVEVQADSSAEAALSEMPDVTAGFAALQTTPDYNTAFMDLEMGSVDAIAMDIIVASYQIQQRNADMVILEESLSAEEYAIGFKKGNTELCEKVEGVLGEMTEDGTLAEISTKWFGEDITTFKK